MTLNTTTVPPQPSDPPRRSGSSSTLLKLFADHSWAARLWFWVAVVAVVLAIAQPYFLVSAYRQRERVVILDEAGTFHVSPLLSFEEAEKLHVAQALLATLALFQRNPAGFDYPEILNKIFLKEGLDQLKKKLIAEKAEFAAKQIHQKVEVFRVDVLRTRSDEVLVEVSGQLIRVGLFNGEPFTESPRFNLRLTLVRNPNLAANGRYPLAVWRAQIQ
ncbi:hypothetical protein DB346_23205 [Verrucomicrobia bacterium LW23]|nr:hypothetical protein DB346_23205 [Verrucomicrobia bacterium LW23]